MEVFEMFTAPERIIVSPVAGVYEPLEGSADVEAGDVIGHVTGPGSEVVEVRSPFAGRIVEVVAWRGERLVARQRVAWLRVAA
jgi:predicted deacylase